MKKYSMGLFFAVTAVLMSLAALGFYLANTRTAYYGGMGLDWKVAACFAAAAVLCAVRIAAESWDPSGISDFLAVCVSLLLAAGFAALVNARLDGLISVLTYENSAANMADTTSCMAALACSMAALLDSVLSAFLDVAEEEPD